MNLITPELVSTLQALHEKTKQAEQDAEESGENFNVFDILQLTANEVRMHSAFIAELLDPKGCHGLGNTFLNLFIEKALQSSVEFDTSTATVEVEKYIGPRNDDLAKGGYVDIVITDAKNERILIENKIYAVDQHLQLLRYRNFDIKAKLLYLTLQGVEPSKESIGTLEENDYICISYKDHIRNWLDACYDGSTAFPVIHETIFQYLILVKKLTNQTRRSKILDDAQTIIRQNPELIDSARTLAQAWDQICYQVKNKFEKQLSSITGRYELSENPTTLEYKAILDNDGLCICFRLIDQATGESTNLEKACPYANVFPQDIEKNNRQDEFHAPNDTWNIGWYTPDGFKFRELFEQFEKTKILAWEKDPKALENICSEIKKRADIRLEMLCVMQNVKQT